MNWLDDLIDRFLTVAADIRSAQAKRSAMLAGGAPGATAYLECCRLLGEAASDGAALIAALDAIEGPAAIDLAGMMVVHCFAAVRASYPARQDAQAARTAIAGRADAAIEATGDAFGADVHAWLAGLIGEAVMQISRIAASSAPLVRVEAGTSLPSCLLAWDLYGDPARGGDMVERARSATPMLMPVRFEALAS